MDFFEGLTYEHLNFIFADHDHSSYTTQESFYPLMNTSAYKFGLSEPGSLSYYDCGHTYVVGDSAPRINEYSSHIENYASIPGDRPAAVHTQHEEIPSSTSHVTSVDCPRDPHNTHDYQVVWQDNVDPDNMTYEELLELGDAVGTQNRGLSREYISLLPISKFKCGFFSRRKSRKERCVICQMEYKRGDQQIILPCKHIYHAGCGSQWLSINKACPICYKDVFADASKQSAK
ncbi:E3 ubiquitin-protein ligase BIG BROTHER-like [Apium graveolens]|uniref:E3 ubiquitin-protein ligase BIG BROTHER-like n=1 Tax=Apium graveolens TaxID=4045 RepID=UPI003D79DCE9